MLAKGNNTAMTAKLFQSSQNIKGKIINKKAANRSLFINNSTPQ